MTQNQMNAINNYGLVGYVECEGELQSSDLIYAYHQHLKTFYAINKSNLNFNGAFRGKRAIIIHNLDGQVLNFPS